MAPMTPPSLTSTARDWAPWLNVIHAVQTVINAQLESTNVSNKSITTDMRNAWQRAKGNFTSGRGGRASRSVKDSVLDYHGSCLSEMIYAEEQLLRLPGHEELKDLLADHLTVLEASINRETQDYTENTWEYLSSLGRDDPTYQSLMTSAGIAISTHIAGMRKYLNEAETELKTVASGAEGQSYAPSLYLVCEKQSRLCKSVLSSPPEPGAAENVVLSNSDSVDAAREEILTLKDNLDQLTEERSVR